MHLPTTLRDRFELMKTFREDADGLVAKVRDRRDGALKTLKWIAGADASTIATSAAEFELLRGIRHPNLTAVLEFDRIDAGCFVLRDFVEGETLAVAGPSLSPADRRRIFASIVTALGHLHGRGLLHGDLKPDNILIRREEAGAVAVLTDFGFSARIDGGTSIAHAHSVRGTPPFIAPELLLGFPPDARADLFALGVTWLVASSSNSVIDERKLYEKFPRVDFLTATGLDPSSSDPEFAAILRALLATDLEERPKSALELLDRIGEARPQDPQAFAPLLEPTPAFFLDEGATSERAIVRAERTLTRESDVQRLLLVGASEWDLRHAETWLRFQAARVDRGVISIQELESYASPDPAIVEGAADDRIQRTAGAKEGRDAERARALLAANPNATILVPSHLLALRDGSFVGALARAVKLGSGDARLVVLATERLIENAAIARLVAPEFEISASLPAISTASLARDLQRLEIGGSEESEAPKERLVALATRLLELAGPNGDDLFSLLREGLVGGSIGVTPSGLDLSRFQPIAPAKNLDEVLAACSIDERTVLASLALLGGFARIDELFQLVPTKGSDAIASLRARGVLLSTRSVFRARSSALAFAARKALPPDELAALAARASRLDESLRSRDGLTRALIAALAGDADRCDEILDRGIGGAVRDAMDGGDRSIPIEDDLTHLVAVLPSRTTLRAKAALMLARTLSDNGRVSAAIATLERIAGEVPRDADVACAVVTRLALLLLASGRTVESTHWIERARSILKERGSKSSREVKREFERASAVVRAASGDAQGAIQQLQLCLRGTGEDLDSGERSLMVLLGGLTLRAGKYAAARRTLETVLTSAKNAKDEAIAASAATNLATLEQREGSLDRAVELLTEALSIRAKHGDLYEEAIVRNNLALALREQGQLDAARKQLAESHAVRLRMGDERGAAEVELNSCMIEVLSGDFQRATKLVKSAFATLLRIREQGGGDIVAAENVAAARCYDLARYGAATLVDDLIERFSVVDQPFDPRKSDPGRAAMQRTLAERRVAYASQLDDLSTALSALREAQTMYEQSGDRFGVARASLEIARRLLEGSDIDGARSELAKARKLASPRLEAELRLVAGLIGIGSGATAEANGEFEQARDLAGRMGLAVTLNEAIVREIVHCEATDPARAEARRIDLRTALPLLKLPDQHDLDAVSKLRRIYGKAVAPTFRVETEHTAMTREGRVLTEGIPEEVFRTFVMINRSVLREKDLDRLLERLLEHAIALTGARRGFVVLLKEGRIAFEARSGELDAENEEISRGIVFEAIQQMRPLVTANAKSDSRLTGRKSIERFDLRSVLCVPFKCFTGADGAIYVDNPVREGVFGTRAVDLLEALASQAAIAIGNIERSREIERLNEELKKRVAFQEIELDQARRELVKSGVADGARRMIAQSEPMRLVVDLARRVAKSDLPVLVLGESGTGKEMLARFVHDASARCARAFVGENCSAIPETLLESEFFGCVKGAFTGADQDRDGLFQKADGGTLFLDEIGDMPLSLQTKLLRVLQEKMVRKVGSSTATPVDVRLVCATHRDVEQMVKDGKFREDLYYRIRGVVLRLPPLRERRDDIPILVEALLERLHGRNGVVKRASKSLLKRLMAHDWPGNVRELESEVTRLYHLSGGDELDEAALELRRRDVAADGESSVVAVRPMDEIERDAIKLALRETAGNREEAARRLGISRAAFYVKLKNYGLQESSPSSRRRKS